MNSMASKVDENATRDFNQAKEWAKTLYDFSSTFKQTTKNDQKEERTEDSQSRFLSRIADYTNNMWKASQSQGTFWVGISKLSTQAQKDIADAIQLAGCCGGSSVSKALDQTTTASAGSADVTAAAKSAIGGDTNIIIADIVGSGNNGNTNTHHKGNGGPNGPGGGPPGGGGGPNGAGPGGLGGFADAAKVAGRWFALATALQVVSGVLERIHSQLVQAVDLNMNKVFAGGVTASNKFKESLRAIIHEQQGFGVANRDIEDQFRSITAHVSASGVERAKYQQIYLQNLSRGLPLDTAEEKLAVKGLRTDKQEGTLLKARTERMQSIQTTALNTANALHMSAEGMNELFMDWHMHLGLSESSLGEMGRHMQNVARNSGVTGAQLETAMKNADGVIKNLKKAGSASIDAMKNVTEFMASAQKHGFDGASEMMNALSSRSNFLESKQRLFLVNSARESGNPNAVNDLVMGKTLQTPDGMKDMMKGQESFVRKLFGNYQSQLSGVGVDAKTIDVSNLSAVIQKLQNGTPQQQQAAAALQRQFEGLGTTVGEAEQSFKALQEASLKPFERIASYTDQLAKMSKEGLQHTDEYNRIQMKLRETSTNLSMDAFGRMNQFSTRIQEAGGVIGGQLEKDMSKSMATLFGSQDEASKWLANLKDNTRATVESVSERASAAGKNLNKLLQKRGVSSQGELEKLLKQGDLKGIKALQESMQEIGVEEKANEDPVTNLRRTLIETNNKLGHLIDLMAFSMSNLSTNILYVGGYLGKYLFDILSIFAAGRGFAVLGEAAGVIGGAGRTVAGAGGTAARTAAPYLGAAAAGIAATVMLAYGAFKGFAEGKEEEHKGKDSKFTAGEGLLYGMLTGGAKTGSFLSSAIGVKKDSGVDKAMGIVGSAAWGASIAASIGLALAPFTAGISIPVAALIGALIGAGTEWFKIMTEGSKVLQRFIIDPIKMAFGIIGNVIGGLWKILTGVLTFDVGKIGAGVKQIFVGIYDGVKGIASRIVEGLITLVTGLPSMFITVLKNVFLEFPNWIINGITGILKSLASNEYIGAIFQPIFEIWDLLKQTWGEVYDLLKPGFEAASNIFISLRDAAWSLIEPLFGASEGASLFSQMCNVLKTGIQVVSAVIGGIIRLVLWPVKIAVQVFAGAVFLLVEAIKKAHSYIKPFIDAVKWLFVSMYNFAKQTIDSIVYVFTNLPSLIGQSLWSLGKSITSWVWGGFSSVPQTLLSSFVSVFTELPVWLFETLTSGLAGLGTWIWDNTIGAMLNLIPDRIKSFLGIESKKTEAVSSLKDTVSAKQVSTPQVSASLAGAFEKDQATEALTPRTVNDAKILQEDFTKRNISVEDLVKSYESSKMLPKNDVSMSYEGAFDKNESKSAIEAATLYDTNRLVLNGSIANDVSTALNQSMSNVKDAKGVAAYQSMGLFDSDKPEEANSDSTSNMINQMYGASNVDLNNIVSSKLLTRQNDSSREKNIVAEVSNALNYERSASDAATDAQATKFSGSTNGSEVNTNLIDYRDELRGEVGTLGLSRASIESSVSQARYGDQPSGSTAMLGMDDILSYLLNVQVGKFDSVINLLTNIEHNTSGNRTAGGSVIGPNVGNGPILSRPGVKNIAKDQTRGNWDLTYGDYSPGAVTTEGRGGSA